MAFRKKGHNAFSCDIADCYGDHPEWHIKDDCQNILLGNCVFKTVGGDEIFVANWDLIIAHPPCTFLSNVQAPLYDKKKFGNEKVKRRRMNQKKAIDFFRLFTQLECRWCIENPPGIMNVIFRKPDQIIQPFWFGEHATKRTCLWLNGLPALRKTKLVTPPEPHKYKNSNSLGEWMYKTSLLPPNERSRARSKTFEGIANAMADQWGDESNFTIKTNSIQKTLIF